ncbi:hypothetical protein [Sphaerimonospora mesophila]
MRRLALLVLTALMSAGLVVAGNVTAANAATPSVSYFSYDCC